MSSQGQLPLPAATEGLIPVAAYVRMSTEHQQYSTENQLDRIKEYAARRGMAIVRIFADEGKSGLSLKGRESLRQMIAEVETGKAEFKGILAYDISRWGRFQDADESGCLNSVMEAMRRSKTIRWQVWASTPVLMRREVHAITGYVDSGSMKLSSWALPSSLSPVMRMTYFALAAARSGLAFTRA